MIRLTVELLPYGSELNVEKLGQVLIINEGELTAKTNGERGSYNVMLIRPGQEDIHGFVDDYRRSLPIWDLITRAMKAAWEGAE